MKVITSEAVQQKRQSIRKQIIQGARVDAQSPDIQLSAKLRAMSAEVLNGDIGPLRREAYMQWGIDPALGIPTPLL